MAEVVSAFSAPSPELPGAFYEVRDFVVCWSRALGDLSAFQSLLHQQRISSSYQDWLCSCCRPMKGEVVRLGYISAAALT